MSQRGITDWRCGICIGGDVQIWGIHVYVGCKEEWDQGKR